MCNVLFISHYAGRTGAPIALLHLLSWLKDNSNLKFDILLASGGELQDRFLAIAPTFIYSPNPSWFSIQSKNSKIKHVSARWLKSRAYSLIYSNTLANSVLVDSIFPSSIPLITHCHEMDYWMDRIGDAALSSAVARTQKFIACSLPSASSLIKRGALSESIEIVPGPFISSKNPQGVHVNLRRALGIPDDSFIILSGGAEGWRKGKDLFVQLAAVLKSHLTHRFDLVWLGSRLDDEFEYWLHASAGYAGVKEYLHWPGSVSNPEDYIGISNCFVMLSREDPMPLIAIEAGSMGLPVICFRSAGGTAEWVDSSGGGCVVDYLNVAEVASAVTRYASDPSLHSRDGHAAERYCRTKFTIDKVGSKILHTISNYVQIGEELLPATSAYWDRL